MRLADFLESHAEAVLTEWVTFARKQPGATSMDLVALRDHAAEMLTDIVADLRSSQTAEAQHTKAQGETVVAEGREPTAAESHGMGRANSGFSVAEMMAEFRALRASVLRLWTAQNGALVGDDIHDLTRFNEAVDQALAESISRFNTSVTQSQDLFVAILGHDLRTPLQTVTVVTEYLAQVTPLDADHGPLLGRAVRSARRMDRMLDDLLDFTRSRTGTGLTMTPADTDLRRVIQEAVDECRTNYPRHEFAVETSGDLHGAWDAPRVARVLCNLVGNAAQHGSASTPVRVSATGEAEAQVRIEVWNDGPSIPPADLPTLFSPFKRLRRGDTTDASHHLGLGLYIADQIVAAHGGRIDVSSMDESGTCFAVHLPRFTQRSAT